MFGKAVLLLVLAAVAVQSYVPYDVEEQLALFEDKKGSFIHELRELIESALKAAKEALENVHKELADKIKELIEIAKTKFSKQYKELLEKINKMKEEAEKLKVDVKECLKGHEEELKNLNEEFVKKVETCNQDLINQSKALVETEKKNAQESVEIIKKLTAELLACGKGAEGLKCKAKVAIEIAKVVREIPAKINNTVKEAIPTIMRLIPVAEKCIVKETSDLVTRELKIAKTVETCIKEKIHPHKQA